MRKQLMPMRLQFFASDDGTNTPSDPVGENEMTPENESPDNDNQAPSQNELDSQIGKAVAKALKNNDKKWQSKLDGEIQKAKSDAEAYAKMTEKEKQDAELAKREQQIIDREKKINDRELLANIKTDLQESKLPLSFATSLLAIQDNEQIKQAISEIKQEWDSQLSEALKASARQVTPQGSANSTTTQSGNTQADIANKAKATRLVK